MVSIILCRVNYATGRLPMRAFETVPGDTFVILATSSMVISIQHLFMTKNLKLVLDKLKRFNTNNFLKRAKISVALVTL
jgi:hypothetical protein